MQWSNKIRILNALLIITGTVGINTVFFNIHMTVFNRVNMEISWMFSFHTPGNAAHRIPYTIYGNMTVRKKQLFTQFITCYKRKSLLQDTWLWSYCSRRACDSHDILDTCLNCLFLVCSSHQVAGLFTSAHVAALNDLDEVFVVPYTGSFHRVVPDS